ncbi:hypothetical protein HYH02_015185 [Chlamydomonas schloesseri]|uniref:Uncharacterized protein n=1 Tax=Chlamydomonas schloesseri TaxID=2026947 RepID=A0A835SPQ8_9CHLO|nr:hypothetical protein HYH02_015185 [Chlamydomonas schloesseri]|eukprot:KAG2424325.1 hypothetical protein HYH02_015185 [Chlamydomonas schloesseri]
MDVWLKGVLPRLSGHDVAAGLRLAWVAMGSVLTGPEYCRLDPRQRICAHVFRTALRNAQKVLRGPAALRTPFLAAVATAGVRDNLLLALEEAGLGGVPIELSVVEAAQLAGTLDIIPAERVTPECAHALMTRVTQRGTLQDLLAVMEWWGQPAPAQIAVQAAGRGHAPGLWSLLWPAQPGGRAWFEPITYEDYADMVWAAAQGGQAASVRFLVHHAQDTSVPQVVREGWLVNDLCWARQLGYTLYRSMPYWHPDQAARQEEMRLVIEWLDMDEARACMCLPPLGPHIP